MKKWCLMVLAALCLLIPTVGSAQGLPDFLQAVQTGLSEGLSAGSAAMEKDLTLSVTASDARVEAGRDVTLTIRAENPRPAETSVALTLSLPERLAAQANEALAWEAALPAAEMDETGALVPSVTTFTRTLTLMPAGESAQGTGNGGDERRLAVLSPELADGAVRGGYFGQDERDGRGKRAADGRKDDGLRGGDR